MVSGGAGSYSDVGSKPYRLKKKASHLAFFFVILRTQIRDREALLSNQILIEETPACHSH